MVYLPMVLLSSVHVHSWQEFSESYMAARSFMAAEAGEFVVTAEVNFAYAQYAFDKETEGAASVASDTAMPIDDFALAHLEDNPAK